VAPNCHYCGKALRRRQGVDGFLDRLVFTGRPTWDGYELVYVCDDDLMFFDHVVPKAKGGRDETTNLVPVCGKCNSLKGSRLSYAEMVERRMA
jgi:5-methylcytosine-specific restriction endonuclease McrA